MRPLRYSINVTLDGCGDHRAIVPDEDLFRHGFENLDHAGCPRVGLHVGLQIERKPLQLNCTVRIIQLMS